MIVTAMQGDTAELLCQRHLGSTASVTEQVLEMNPGIATFGVILPMGTQVSLPDQVQSTDQQATFIQLWD